MAWYKKTATDGSSDNMLHIHEGRTGCCGDSAITPTTVSNSAHDLGSTTLDKIVIDGTTYTFGTAGSTAALVKAGVVAALTSAGYQDLDSEGVTVSGVASATVAVITSTATITKFIDSGASDVTLS